MIVSRSFAIIFNFFSLFAVANINESNYQRVLSCTESYVAEFGKIFGTNRSDLVKNRMLEMMNPEPTSDPIGTKMIFGVGPGTSGTRSLYLAMMLLNVTGRHFWDESSHCRTHKGTEFNLDFTILTRHSPPSSLFWTDHPVPARWLQFYFQFPNAKFIMTDIDEHVWHKKRRADHCNRNIEKHWDQCNVPLPFSMPFVHNAIKRREEMLRHRDVYEAVHLVSVSEQTSNRVYQLYRQFVRCVIPQERLLWLNMSALPPSREFWTQLVDFTGIEVSRQGLELMIGAGVPHQGTKGCKFSGKECEQERRADGYHYVYPSVCYNVTT